jgi:hypothetical protein
MTKNTVFGIVYGLGEDSVFPYVVAKIRAVEGPNADLKGITAERCKKTHRKFFEVHTEVAEFHADMRYQAEKKHFVESLFGFRREIREKDDTRSTYWGNQAVNSPVQSTAHTFILICLALLDLDLLRPEDKRHYPHLIKCIMEVHDALYFLVKLRYLRKAYSEFMQLFEHDAVEYAEKHCLPKGYGELQVPILAETKAGLTMATMVDYEGEPLDEFLEKWREKAAKVHTKSWEDLMRVA